jgi:hypothetical protein
VQFFRDKSILNTARDKSMSNTARDKSMLNTARDKIYDITEQEYKGWAKNQRANFEVIWCKQLNMSGASRSQNKIVMKKY